MKILLFAILLLWSPAKYLAQEDECGEEEDALGLAREKVYRTETLSDILGDDIAPTPERVKKKIDKQVDGDEAITQIRDALNLDNDPTGEMALAAAGDETKQLEAATNNLYFDLCPERWYRLNYWQWYFWYPGRKYCWAVYNVWVSKCINRYCKFSPVKDISFFYYRCVPEYRLTFIPAVCVTVTSDNTLVWRREYLRRYLPRGCSCRRYWRWQLEDSTCPLRD